MRNLGSNAPEGVEILIPGQQQTHFTDITSAVKEGSFEHVKNFLTQDPQCVNEKDSDNVTPLHWACLDNYLSIAKLLVENGAPLDVETISEGHTPLSWACIRGHSHIAYYLIKNGADINKRDKRGYHALHHAAMYDKLDVIYYLLESGCNVNVQDSEGHTPLMWAAYMGYIPTIQILLRYKANVSTTDSKGFTALHWACAKGHPHSAELLISHGAEIMATDAEGKTPYDEAKRKNHDGVANFLDIARKNPKVASEGRKSFKTFWFLIPWIFVPYMFFVFAYTPIFVLAVPLISAPVGLFWRFYGQHRWISVTNDTNPFWIAIVLASYIFSIFVYFTQMVPYSEITSNTTILFTVYNCIWSFCYFKLLFTNPGTIPKDTATREEIFAELDRGKNNKFCISCMARKPIRSKHCRTCNQCVARFDHYCPWLNNDVGFHNHPLFLIVLTGIVINHSTFVYFSYNYLSVLLPEDISYLKILPFLYNASPLVLELCLFHFFFNLWQGYNLLFNFLVMGYNLTTNEVANRTKYKYLSKNGKFFNYFDRGVIGNIIDFFKPSYNWYTLYDLPMQAETV